MRNIKVILRESSHVMAVRKIYGKLCGLVSFRYRNKVLDENPKEAIRYLESVHPCPSEIMTPVELGKSRLYDLSIIIPAHNAEKYLEQCLRSVFEQKTRYSYEIIVIENASQDRTWDILCGLKKDSRLKILRSEKADPSAARNLGLRSSGGKYLMFVDADDYLLPDTIEHMMNSIQKHNADIAVCGFKKLEEGRLYNYPVSSEEIIWTDLRSMLQVYGFAWGKLYKWEIFDKVCFPENLWYEDTIIHLEIFPKAKKMLVLPIYGLVYRRNADSITAHHEETVRCLDTLWVMQAILQKRADEGEKCDEIIYEELLKHFSDISWIRIRRQPQKIKESFFCAAAYYLEQERKNIKEDTISPKMRKLDKIFSEKKEKLWESYCKFES